MPDLIQREHLDTDPLDCLREQIKTATEGRMAISRYGLAEIVAERTGMPLDQAQLLVHAYCDEYASHVPAYLGREFNLFWPKVLAFVFAVAGTGIFWYGVTLRQVRRQCPEDGLRTAYWFGLGSVQDRKDVGQNGLRNLSRSGAQRNALAAYRSEPALSGDLYRNGRQHFQPGSRR